MAPVPPRPVSPRRTPTLRHLRYFVTAFDTGHFGRAAEVCHVTQPTLSAGIKQMEELLGVTLFERGPAGVMPTSAARAIDRRARDLLRDAEDLTVAALRHADPLAGSVRLAGIPTILPYVLPAILPELRRRFPALELRLEERRTEDVLDRLANGTADIGLIALPYPLDDLASEVLLDDPLVLACRRDHPLAKRPEIGPADLARADLLLLEDGHCLRAHALAACSLADRRRGEDIVGTSLATLVQMVAGGLGVTLLPTVALPRELEADGELTVVPLTKDAPSRRIALVCRAGYPAIEGFHSVAAAMREVLGRATGSVADGPHPTPPP